MAELKTQPNDASVEAFIQGVEDDKKRADCRAILDILGSATGETAKMWGSHIVGFGSYHYKYESGREGDWFLAGFAPRKRNLTLYIMPGFDAYAGLLDKLGKYKTGKSCLHINKLDDVDVEVLRQLVETSVSAMRARHSSPG